MRGASLPTVGRATGRGANGLSIGVSSSSTPGVRNGFAGLATANGLAAGVAASRSARNGLAGGAFVTGVFSLAAPGSSQLRRAAFEPCSAFSQ